MRSTKVHVSPFTSPSRHVGRFEGARCGRTVFGWQALTRDQFAAVPSPGRCRRCARLARVTACPSEVAVAAVEVAMHQLHATFSTWPDSDPFVHGDAAHPHVYMPWGDAQPAATEPGRVLSRCPCGRNHDSLFDAWTAVAPEHCDVLRNASGEPARGNWCTYCLRVRGEWHKVDCRLLEIERTPIDVLISRSSLGRSVRRGRRSPNR